MRQNKRHNAFDHVAIKTALRKIINRTVDDYIKEPSSSLFSFSILNQLNSSSSSTNMKLTLVLAIAVLGIGSVNLFNS